jgi:hypothetical protein
MKGKGNILIRRIRMSLSSTDAEQKCSPNTGIGDIDREVAG